MNFLKWDRRWLELAILMILMVTTTLLFWLTDLDRQFAALFFHPENANDFWPERHAWLWRVLYDYTFPFTVIIDAAALLIYIVSFFRKGIQPFRHQALFVFLVIVIGPGLLVNLIIKDHWGRARPVHIQEFGGTYQYTPPLKLGDTPDKSFVCGHCSIGASFIVLYFLAQNYKAFYLLLTFGMVSMLGVTRMTAGGHFLSDILWSAYLVFLVAYALYYGWYIRPKSVT